MASDSSQIHDVSTGSSESQNMMGCGLQTKDQDTAPAPFEVVKVYPSRGPLTQYRLASATNFKCNRCQQQKKAKLVATRDSQWDALLCNGCYGFLLSREWKCTEVQLRVVRCILLSSRLRRIKALDGNCSLALSWLLFVVNKLKSAANTLTTRKLLSRTVSRSYYHGMIG